MYSQNEKQILVELKNLSSKGKIEAINSAPNAVGMTFKKEMGFNSHNYINFKYKGFTLRTSNQGKGGTSFENLFARVPNWEKSECKSSTEIAKLYGVVNLEKNMEASINCTVSAVRPNSFGFILKLDRVKKLLLENYMNLNGYKTNVCVWDFKDLEERLLNLGNLVKVNADKYNHNNKNYFHYSYASFSGQPNFKRFLDLLEEGNITLDHLIGRKFGEDVATEKGPKFRLKSSSNDRLFPDSRFVDLLD